MSNKDLKNDIFTVEIPFKMIGLNDYIRLNRSNKFSAASYKKKIEASLVPCFAKIPVFTKPIKINFIWIEGNRKRDLDNICFSKKFILDALVKSGKILNDSQKYVVGFSDNFKYADDFKVILEISEVEYV